MHSKVVSDQDRLIAYRVQPKRFVHIVNTAQVSLMMPEPRLSITVTDHWFDSFDSPAISFQMWNSNVLMHCGIFFYQMLIYKTFNSRNYL